jgi:hypothetical protein
MARIAELEERLNKNSTNSSSLRPVTRREQDARERRHLVGSRGVSLAIQSTSALS